jgi:CHASE3 domain sensor protein
MGMTPFRRRMILLASAVILVVALQLLPGIDFSRARRAQDLAAQNLLRIHALDALLLAVDDAQTGQRGYILTGDERYLTPYNEALVRQSGIRGTLRQSLGVDDLRRSQFDTLERLADGELGVLSRSIEVRRTQGFEAALALVTTREGQSLMEQIRSAVSAMRAEESRLFTLRNREAETSASDLSLSFRLGGVILTILLLFAGWANEREIASRQRSVDSLKDSEQRFRTLADAIPQ